MIEQCWREVRVYFIHLPRSDCHFPSQDKHADIPRSCPHPHPVVSSVWPQSWRSWWRTRSRRVTGRRWADGAATRRASTLSPGCGRPRTSPTSPSGASSSCGAPWTQVGEEKPMKTSACKHFQYTEILHLSRFFEVLLLHFGNSFFMLCNMACTWQL